MKYTKIFFALCAMSLSLNVSARPVSYPGGITAMFMNDEEANNIHLHYSPTVKYSLGYKGEYWREQEWFFHGIQFNYLAKRWNKPAAQANFYVKSGLGFTQSNGKFVTEDTQTASFIGISADWENRRIFTSYSNRYYDAGDITHFFTQQARAGIAPYLGDYGDLHTWIMVQIDHNTDLDDKTVVTPLLRFFKNEYLVELGINDNGGALFNFIARF